MKNVFYLILMLVTFNFNSLYSKANNCNFLLSKLTIMELKMLDGSLGTAFQTELGWRYYEDSLDNPQSNEKASYYWKKAANKGDIYAKRSLELLHKNRADVSKGHKKLIKEIIKTGRQEDINYLFDLGSMYYNGIIVRKSYKKAVAWWKKAANKGHGEAAKNLGILYMYGKGVPKCHVEAFKWFFEYEMIISEGS